MLFVHDTPSTLCPIRRLGASWRSPLERTRAGARHPQPQPLPVSLPAVPIGPAARHLHAATILMADGICGPRLAAYLREAVSHSPGATAEERGARLGFLFTCQPEYADEASSFFRYT
jgi:hypothetical protein